MVAFYSCKYAIEIFNPKIMLFLYEPVVRPILFYRELFWYTAVGKKTIQKEADLGSAVSMSINYRSTKIYSLFYSRCIIAPATEWYFWEESGSKLSFQNKGGLSGQDYPNHTLVLCDLGIDLSKINCCTTQGFNKNFHFTLPNYQQWDQLFPFWEDAVQIFTDASKMGDKVRGNISST